ncbi:MAG: SEL1-like repeat protein [Caulobacterales bacterium]|nr:SEL1-like repeat protein [Caulobacterales bacterium]
MSAGAPWSVKGIDPKAREVAKDLARRSGMTLGEWLNRVILEDDLPDEVSAESQFAERPQRMSDAIPHLRAVPSSLPPIGSPDIGRVAVALDRLTDRIEASETRTGLAISGVEHSIRQALARIETAEREQQAAAQRLEGLLAETNAEQSYFGERLRRLEAEPGPRADETSRALEGRLARAEPEQVVEAVLARLGDRIAAAEARTGAALADLKGAFVALDRRLGAVEQGGVGEQAELRFEALAQVFTHRLDAVRAEVAEKLAAAGGPEIEARFAQMGEAVRAAEQRSAKAVEEMGRQVLSMAEAVGRKLLDVDERSAQAIDQVGTEVARVAGAVELRLARGEQTQAEAFERLSGELTRVTEALTERLAVSEQRAAAAIEGVGDQVARVTERIEARHDRAAIDAAARMAEVETRAAEQLRPTQTDFAQTDLAQTDFVQPDLAEPDLAEPDLPQTDLAATLGPPPEPELESELEPELAFAAAAAFGPELFSRAEPEPAPGAEPRPETVHAAWRRLDLDVPEPEVPESFAPIVETDEDLFAADPQDRPPVRGPELSTREVIEQARAAARAASQGPGVPEGTEALRMRAKVGAGVSGRLFTGFGKPKKQATTLQTALMVAGGAAFLSVSAAGLTLMQGPARPQEPAQLEPQGVAPRAAVALAPGFAPAPAADALAVAPPSFEQVRAEVEAGHASAIDPLRALAAAGDPQAQLYLADLLDAGRAGLARDPTEARRLTALAADAGDAKAMHNLGVYEFRGEGGPVDLASAVGWFRRAASAGVVESQYNLGLLYQSGSGVPKDLAQARHWFGLAAQHGDAEARKALAELTPPKREIPRAAAPARAALRPSAARRDPPAGSPNVMQAQVILARLGYFEGSADGHVSDAYRVALFRYQQDQRDQMAGPRPYAVAVQR